MVTTFVDLAEVPIVFTALSQKSYTIDVEDLVGERDDETVQGDITCISYKGENNGHRKYRMRRCHLTATTISILWNFFLDTVNGGHCSFNHDGL